ncbi:hypothetical protein MMC10_004121 [Thelotrema lepadinum]|nr:hypothetical protein [Thelotrema lepadinum]
MEPFTAIGWDQGDLSGLQLLESSSFAASRLLSSVLSILYALPNLSQRIRKHGLMLQYHHVPLFFSIAQLPSPSASFTILTTLHLIYPDGDLLDVGFYEKYDNHEPYEKSNWEEPLSRFLKACPNLKELDIAGAPDVDSEVLFGHRFVWPHLYSLSLSRVVLYREHMLRFFRRHRATLKYLVLKRVALYDEKETHDWESFIPFLERAKGESRINLSNFIGYKLGEVGTLDLYHVSKKWHKRFPNLVPFERALRYLMCGKKTNRFGRKDLISRYPYDWTSITFDSVRDSKAAWIDYLRRKDEVAS